MKRSHIVVPICILLMSIRLGFCRSEETESIEHRRSEYQRAIAGVKSLFATVHGAGRLIEEASIGSPNQRTVTCVVEFAQKPGMFKCIFQDPVISDKQGVIVHRPGSALCYNKSMSFKLKKATSGDSYVVNSTGKSDEDEVRSILNISRMAKFLDCPYWMAGALGGPVIADYLARPEFMLERSEPVVMNNKNLLKIHFKYKPMYEVHKAVKKPSAGGSRIESGWLLVSPDENWVVYQEEVHYTRTGDTSTDRSFSVEYEGNHSGTPLPKRAQLKTAVRIYNDKKEMKLKDGTVVHDGDVASIETFEFDTLSFDEVPDREFTLPAFGLPDLGSPDRLVRRDYSFVWMFLAASLALIIALGLKYYSSRTDASRGTESTA